MIIMMKRMKFLAMAMTALLCVTGFTACGDDNDDPGIPTPQPSAPLTAMTVKSHLVFGEELLKYAQVTLVNVTTGDSTVLKASDFKPVKVADIKSQYLMATDAQIRSLLEQLYRSMGLFSEKEKDSVFYDYTFTTTLSSFPAEQKYKLTFSSLGNLASLPDTAKLTPFCQAYPEVVLTGTPTGMSAQSVSTQYNSIAVAKWDDFLKFLSGKNSITITCNADKYVYLSY